MRLSTLPIRSLTALALLFLAPRAPAGPALACPGGPDPLRFRPEAAVASASADPEPVAVAAALDPANGREWVAVAYLTPAREVAVGLSGDGGCTFSGIGGGFLPVVVTAAGVAVADRPAVALRVAGTPVLAVAWREGRRVIVRGSSTLDGSFGPEVELDAGSLGPPRLSLTTQGAPLLAAAWLHDDLGTGVPRAALTATALDAAAWGAPVDVRPSAAAEDVEVACDLAGAGGGPGCTLLAALAGGQAHAARLDDPAGAWAAFRRVDDGSGTRVARAASAASAQAGPAAWSALAWASVERSPPGAVVVNADASLHDSGAMASDFDGAVGSPNPVIDAAGAPEARPAVAVAGAGPGATAFVTFEEAGEIQVARRPLAAPRPRLVGGCGPARLTGLSPARATGSARAPAAAALGDDVVLAFVDDRSGSPQVFVKRSDAVPPVVTITAANPAACGAPPRVDLQWSAPPCDSTLVTVEVGTTPGGTDFTRTLAPASSLLVEGLEPGVTYYFRVRVRDAADNEGVSEEVSAATPSCAAALLDASLTTVTDACAAGGAGGDGVADPGETLQLTARFENGGTATAPAVRVRLQSRSPAVTVRTAPLDVGDLAVGASIDVTFDVDVSATAACTDSLLVLARADAGGTAWSDMLTLPTRAPCTTCRLGGCSVTADASRSLPLTICRGAQVTLDASASTSASCAGILVHEWWDGGNLLGTGTALTQQPTATTTYRLASRCSTDFDCRGETTVRVVVNQLPSLAFTETPPPPHCVGDVVTLTATSNGAGATFAWADGPTGPSRTVTASGPLTATVTDANGCQRTRSVRVEFGEIPPAEAGPDVVACGSVRLGGPGYPLLDYAWDPPDDLSDPRAAQPMASPPGPTTYTLTVTDPLTGCSAQDSVSVSVAPAPGPYRDFRLARRGASLVATWELDPTSSAVRVYADDDAARAASANGSSGTARRVCEGGLTCTAPLPPEPLLFLQAVGICLDGVTEGPNG